MENYAFRVKERLKKVDKEHLSHTDYAESRASFRQINLSDIYDNLLNPIRLIWAERQVVEGEERFNCYFVYNNRKILRSIIKFENGNVKILNVIKPKQKWQKQMVRKRL